MTPSSFTFKLSVPNDPALVSMVASVARHAAEYAKLDGDAAATFVGDAQSAVARALDAGAAGSTQVVFAAADGTLSARVGGETVTAALA